MHRKLVFVKVESSVIEISKSNHWSRRCYAISLIGVWNEMVYGRFSIEIKHLYPCFIAEINYGCSFWCV